MYCLHCGSCCRELSPLSDGPCPHLEEIELGGEMFCVCAVYSRRPQQCRDHTYPFSVCPVGLSVLGIDRSDSDRIRARVDTLFLAQQEAVR